MKPTIIIIRIKETNYFEKNAGKCIAAREEVHQFKRNQVFF